MKILALVALIATSCGFNQIDKKEKSNRSQSNCVDKCFNQDAQAFEMAMKLAKKIQV